MLSYLVATGERYWPRETDALAALPVPASGSDAACRLAAVALPDWAADLGVGSPSALVVDAATLAPGEGPAFERCDWWQAAFHHLAGTAEWRHELLHGPAHSYAFRLRGVESRSFDHAWVNRIFLFLRRWAARRLDRPDTELFGPLPAARFDLTHDVDAVEKTPALRLKQAAFAGFNAVRLTAAGRVRPAARKVAQAGRFLARGADYWRFPALRELETRFGVRSTFHFYAPPAGRRRGVREALFDPAYDPRDPRMAAEIRTLLDGGWTVGLHPAFDSWESAPRITAERAVLSAVTGTPVVRCRQHWLRFSWRRTWAAQQAAGLELDASLGFNDRPGFRNGCALRFQPWDPERRAPRSLTALPLLLMDSHLYDYQVLDDESRRSAMERWLGEVKAVGGEVSLLWHQRVLDPDYGWAPGYEELLTLATAP